jgi:hypothetical protein
MHPKIKCIVEHGSNGHNNYYPIELLEIFGDGNGAVGNEYTAADIGPYTMIKPQQQQQQQQNHHHQQQQQQQQQQNMAIVGGGTGGAGGGNEVVESKLSIVDDEDKSWNSEYTPKTSSIGLFNWSAIPNYH